MFSSGRCRTRTRYTRMLAIPRTANSSRRRRRKQTNERQRTNSHRTAKDFRLGRHAAQGDQMVTNRARHLLTCHDVRWCCDGAPIYKTNRRHYFQPETRLVRCGSECSSWRLRKGDTDRRGTHTEDPAISRCPSTIGRGVLGRRQDRESEGALCGSVSSVSLRRERETA